MTRLTGPWRGATLALLLVFAVSAAPLDATRDAIRRTLPPATAPLHLVVNTHESRIALDWRPVDGATAYQVFRAAAGVWSPVPVATVQHSRYWSSGLTAGILYEFKVAAVNRAGAGPVSKAVKALSLAAPQGLTAAAGHRQVTLAWLASAGATGYDVLRSIALEDRTFSVIAANVSGPMFVDTGLTNGTKYIYRVRAVAGSIQSRLSPRVQATPTPPATPAPTAAPANLAASLSGAVVALHWDGVTGATSYLVFRSATGTFGTTPVATVTTTTFSEPAPAAGVTYAYKVAAHNDGGDGPFSPVVSVSSIAAPANAPANLVSSIAGGLASVTWSPVATATSYDVFRTTNGVFGAAPLASVSASAFTEPAPAAGVTYTYKVAGRNAGGLGPFSSETSVTPPPSAPIGVSATPASGQTTVAWAAVAGATAYKVYRATAPSSPLAAVVASGLTASPFVDTGLTNGTAYFYTVTAVGAGGESPRSTEVSATPTAPAPNPNPTTTSAFRLLRQSTWGPKPGDVERIVGAGASGVDVFLAEQFAASPSGFPDALFDQPLEVAQEHFMQLALTGPDQLRQRVAWALHKIWVVSGVEVNSSRAIVTYYRLMMDGAFGNYRDLMRAVTLNPAMGRYLNMVNNRAQAVTGVPANENYPRELMQLFTLGLTTLNPDGTPVLDSNGQPVPSYTEDDVKALARILTGWTYGDGNPSTIPTGAASTNYGVPMEAVARYHDTTAKTFLGESFAAGRLAQEELDQALDVIFDHPNLGPFVSRQLIQQLVTSNPSSAYVADVAAVFNSGGSGRGDLAAVVRAILTHPEAGLTGPGSGKLAEPVLFVVSQLRALNATVTDHPFMSDKVAEMGQNLFFPGSVFSYFSPAYGVRGTGTPPLKGPEFQGLTSVTALVRANFVGSLLGGRFGTAVAVDYTPFVARAANAADLVDYVSLVFSGGRQTPEQRSEIIAAVSVTAATSAQERVRTAIYLTLVPGLSQVDR